MKIGILAILCLFSTKAIASSADSGRCPWKLPFTIHVHAVGLSANDGGFSPEEGPGQTLLHDTIPDSEDLSFMVDTGYVIHNDTLQFDSVFDGLNAEHIYMIFAHGQDSVISILCYGTQGGWPVYFTISSLNFDSTSIYSTDSSFRRHSAEVTLERYSTTFIGRHDYVSYVNFFLASSVSLSGIFRPAKFTMHDVQPAPFHVPFNILLKAKGMKDSIGQQFPDSTELTCTAWFLSSHNPDTFYFTSGKGSGGLANDTSLTISFVSGTDSIEFVALSITSTTLVAGPYLQDQWETNRIQTIVKINDLVRDSSSIFSSDSSFCSHRISINTSQSIENYYNSQLSSDTLLLFTATSATLSGIFRPTHYTCAESVSESRPMSDFLTIVSANNSLHCSFGASANPRTMEVYSILGVTVTTSSIPAGAYEATVSQLPKGFYFVRLGGEVAKAIIP